MLTEQLNLFPHPDSSDGFSLPGSFGRNEGHQV